jgi:TolB-like protein/thioredoxin-like negative regulator of GroEL
MAEFFAELKRRQMFRVAAAYAVLAWLLLQIVNNVAPVLDLPIWVARAFLLALVIGFPIALLFVWMRELAPADAAAPRAVTTKLDYVLAGGLVLVIALLSYQQLASTPPQASAPQSDASQPATGNIAIAVLPFANVSGDASREFFSDGMTDEISGALAKVRDLRVIARSSAFQFKGQNQDVRAVGQALGASHLIEVSVRQAGNRVRITAQLVRAGDGVQLWSENYDRELTDIFAIQEDIAQAIATSLRVPLGLQQGERLITNRTSDLESYDQYLRARTLYRSRAISEAIRALEPFVGRDPNFAPAWTLLARAYNLLPNYSSILRTDPVDEARSSIQALHAKAEMAAQQAIRADPRDAGGYSALADMKMLRGNWREAEDLFRQALALDASDPDTLARYEVLLQGTGRLKEAMAVAERLRILEPFVPIYNVNAALSMQLNGQNQASIAFLENIPPDAAGNFFRNAVLARGYAADGRYSEAADTLLAISGRASRQSVEDAARLLRQAPAKAGAPRALPRLEGELSLVYAFVGALDRVLEYPERAADINFLGGNPLAPLWHPLHAPLRKTERFKALVRRIGLVDYWRARGWPDLCRPVGADDFVCD